MKIFYSYSHEDKKHRDKIAEHLHSLRDRKLIDEWHDAELKGGDDFDEFIDRMIDEADIILFLISSNFFKSEYINKREIGRAMKRHMSGAAQVIPIMLSPLLLTGTPFEKLHFLPAGASVMDKKWRPRAEAYKNIAKGLEDVVRSRANHLLISPASEFSRMLRDQLLAKRRSLGIGRDHTLTKYEKVRKSSADAPPTDCYVQDYKRQLEEFLTDNIQNNYIFTIYPDENRAVLSEAYERDVVKRLGDLGKGMVCFESGTTLLDAVKAVDLDKNNPVCVIETDQASGVRTIIERYLARGLPRGSNVHLVMIPGPDSPSQRKRWRVYQLFLFYLHLRHANPGAWQSLESDAGFWNSVCDPIGAKDILRITMNRPLPSWDRKEARKAAERLVTICDFDDETFTTCFICGNDDVADEARKAVHSYGKSTAIREGRAVFIGFDGTETMIKELDAGTSGATMRVNFEAMCDCAVKAYANLPYPREPYSIAASLRMQTDGQSA